MQRHRMLALAAAAIVAFAMPATAQQVFSLYRKSDGTVQVYPSVTKLIEQDFEPMTFQWEEFGDLQIVRATGRIVPGTASRLKAFLDQHRVRRGATVALNSPGGDLGEGLLMGRLVRSYGLNTSVSRKCVAVLIGECTYGTYGSYGSRPDAGECDSSCNFVFMGGVVREQMGVRSPPGLAPPLEGLSIGSHFGVHRFQRSDEGPPSPRSTNDPNSLPPIETAQIASAVIVQFLQEMGVDPNFLTYMANFREITYLPDSVLRELRVVFDKPTTKWEMVSKGAAFVLEARTGVPPAIDDLIELVCERTSFGSSRRLVARLAISSPFLSLFGWSNDAPVSVRVQDEVFFPGMAATGFEYGLNNLLEPIRRDGNGRVVTAIAISPDLVAFLVTRPKIHIGFMPAKNSSNGGLHLPVAQTELEVFGSQQLIRQFVEACR